MKQINCDKCEKDFDIKVKIEPVINDVKRVFFVCPHCDSKYVAYYIDAQIEKQQNEIRIIQNKISECKIGSKKHEKLCDEFKKLKKDIGLNMEKLKLKYEIKKS